jgi:hypothetical protein
MSDAPCACQAIEHDNIMPGWSCCHCKRHHGGGTYNSDQRTACKYCGHHRGTPVETGALGGALAPILSEALEGASGELAQLTADTLNSPEVDAAVTRLGWKVAAFAAGGVAVGIVAGMFIWRRL